MYFYIIARFGIFVGILPILCRSVPLRVGPRVPDAFDMGLTPDDEQYDENDDSLHANEGASKYINLGKGPDMVAVDGPTRVQAELVEAMEAAEAKRLGVAAPDQPDAKSAIIKPRADKKKQKPAAEYEDDDGDNDDDDEVIVETEGDEEEDNDDDENAQQKHKSKFPQTNKAKLRTLGRMLSSTDEYDSNVGGSESDYDEAEEAAEMWEQLGKIANKFKERSRHMKNSLSSVNDKKAAAVDLRREVVGQLAELSVSLSETWPFSKKDALIEQLGAAKNTIEQSIDSILLDSIGGNLHYDQDNL